MWIGFVDLWVFLYAYILIFLYSYIWIWNIMNNMLQSKHQVYKFFLQIILVFLLICHMGCSRPFRGVKYWDAILCVPSGVKPSSAPDPSEYNKMIFSNIDGSVNSAWKKLSNNGFYISGSVNGWFKMGKNSDEFTKASRQDKMAQCLKVATENGYKVKPSYGIMYITYPSFDLFGAQGYAFFSHDSQVGAYMHEVGHGLGFAHSFTANYNYKNSAWGKPGQYGNAWDTMSYANTFMIPSPTNPTKWGKQGPGLNAYHLDRMGWIPRDKIYRFGANGLYNTVITLAPLSSQKNQGYLLARIPIDIQDKFTYLTVEYRVKDSLDGGLPSNKVLINQIRTSNDNGKLVYNSYLIMQNNTGPYYSDKPASSLKANYTQISVISSDNKGAIIRIVSNLAKRCLQGYVWREATPDDFTCVTVQRRSQTRDDNSHQEGRKDNIGICIHPWVLRKATQTDTACVSESVAEQIAHENAKAFSLVDPKFAQVFKNSYGPNTCKQGYVWRQADISDWVCVPPSTRAQVKKDNSVAASRWVKGAYGPQTCVIGYVWRQAFPEDKVCVVPRLRTQAKQDNQKSNDRLQKPQA